METIYYSLDAKRLTVCGEAAGRRASGGQETVCYAFVPRPRRPVTPAGGKVVDFTAYRQAAHPEEYAPREEAPGRPRPVWRPLARWLCCWRRWCCAFSRDRTEKLPRCGSAHRGNFVQREKYAEDY